MARRHRRLKYPKDTRTGITLKLIPRADADIGRHLDSVGNISAYLRKLIREDIKRKGGPGIHREPLSPVPPGNIIDIAPLLEALKALPKQLASELASSVSVNPGSFSANELEPTKKVNPRHIQLMEEALAGLNEWSSA